MSFTSKLAFLLSCCFLIAGTVFGQKTRFPRFEDYPVKQRFTGKPALVNLRSDPKARLFRTMLREGAKKGPNFAGHYTLVTWGCGSDCRVVAVVDAVTGKVYFAPFTVSFGTVEGEGYRIDSRLYVANPPELNEFPYSSPMMDVYKPSWWVWRNNRFVKIRAK